MNIEVTRNERDWTGQIVSWIKSEIQSGKTVFQDVTNDTSIRSKGSQTLFPDILLFLDKTAGLIFNGWELKFPDTPVDDHEMLLNALEKARRLNSNSFVTWNGVEAVIWEVTNDEYTIEALIPIKRYERDNSIKSRDDLSVMAEYVRHEPALHKRVLDILHDLETFYLNGDIKPAINVSDDFIIAIRQTSSSLIPLFKKAIENRINTDSNFRNEFFKWKVIEDTTIRMLTTSSRKKKNLNERDVLAKFVFYNLIGKIIFYLTLSANLGGELRQIVIDEGVHDVISWLNHYFDDAKKIDYQAIFKPYFTDNLSLDSVADDILRNLVSSFLRYDFRILPTTVVAHVLSNIVPNDDKLSFGQYFTSEILADLVAFPLFTNQKDCFLDPTAGTGTFLNSFYNILSYYGMADHQTILSQIWGNDISHFPAILSVINLYKQGLQYNNNFPRVLRGDFFGLKPGDSVYFPHPKNHRERVKVEIPHFDAIASNFPFIQQEDIPNDILSSLVYRTFGESQKAFMKDGKFKINERADYFTFFVYHALSFLKEKGRLSAITSNAWLGKEYGVQFKQFILENFHVKYVVRSRAEHWFKESQVSTVFFVLERENLKSPTKFVTINSKLADIFNSKETNGRMAQLESWYAQLEYSELKENNNWEKSSMFDDLLVCKDRSVEIALIPFDVLYSRIQDNWNQFFISAHIFDRINKCLIKYQDRVTDVYRGERTGWNQMFILKNDDIEKTKINRGFLIPYIKKPSELRTLALNDEHEFSLFVCHKEWDLLDEATKRWIERFKNQSNKNSNRTIEEACAGRKPFWYSLSPKCGRIFTAINPYERFFFAFSNTPFAVDQRLIAMNVHDEYDSELVVALLNSSVTFLILEMTGTSRHLGALDLNAGFLKKMYFLNPDLLTPGNVDDIKRAFEPLKKREIKSIFEEVKSKDRIFFDKIVLEAFGLDQKMLKYIYELLVASAKERVELKKK